MKSANLWRLFVGVFALSNLGVFLTTPVFWAAAEEEPAELALQIILVNTSREAEDILQRLKAGEPFDKLAREHSLDPAGPEGGYIGKVKRAVLRPELRDALKGKAAGHVTNVIQTPGGYVILKVLSEAEVVEFESAKLGITGTNRMLTEVSGFAEVFHFYRRLQKLPDWQQDLRAACEAKRQALHVGIENLASFLSAAETKDREQHDSNQVMDAYQLLAQLRAYQANMADAIRNFQAAYQIGVSKGSKDIQLILEEQLGITHLRRGQIEHCEHNHNAQCCLLPLRFEGSHRRLAHSEKAIKHFLQYLVESPEDLEVKWLLNLAYMTLGKYPHDVPKEHLIPPAAFESEEDIGRFVDVAPSVGLATFNEAGGAIMDDFDNDGFLDIVTSSFDNCAPMHFFRNQGDGTFGDRTAQAGLTKQLGGLNLIQADYNNDGWLDILVLRGAWELPIRKSLLRNNGDGTFTDVTHEAGLAVPATATQTAAWADFDNDGNIDLFVGNEFAPSQLFRNHGDGTFTDVAHRAGVDRVRFTKGVVAGDYDNDGYADFYVSNRGTENFLWHNNRDGTFTEVARQAHVQNPIWSFPVFFLDYNNDGWWDLFAPSYVISVTEAVRGFLKLPSQAETSRLYMNTGEGSFRDVSKQIGLDRAFMVMGANFGDVDNDGFLDFYLGTGSPSFVSLVPAVLLRNREGERFVDITTSSGTGHLGKGHGIAFGDIDNDGDEDIFFEVGGAVPGDLYANALFRNPGHGNNWISIRLVGVKTNRAAIGARLKLTLEGEGGTRRTIYREVTSGGSFGASPLAQHMGLGRAPRVATLEVSWPTSDTRQLFHDVAPNQFIEIKEFEKDFVTLKRRTIPIPPEPSRLMRTSAGPQPPHMTSRADETNP